MEWWANCRTCKSCEKQSGGYGWSLQLGRRQSRRENNVSHLDAVELITIIITITIWALLSDPLSSLPSSPFSILIMFSRLLCHRPSWRDHPYQWKRGSTLVSFSSSLYLAYQFLSGDHALCFKLTKQTFACFCANCKPILGTEQKSLGFKGVALTPMPIPLS